MQVRISQNIYREERFDYMNLLIRTVIVAILVGVILTTVQSYSDDARYEVISDDYEALQEAYDELYEGYNELQTDYTKAVERIEYLEYKLEEKK